MHKVAIIDDHTIVRSGIAAMINKMENFDVFYEAGHGKEFIDDIWKMDKPELVIVDLNMPVMDGYETMAFLKKEHPEIKCLALTVDYTDDAMMKAIRSGARGFVKKNASPAVLRMAMESILLTGYFHTEDLHSVMMNNPGLITKKEKERKEGLERITPRELDFLKLVCDPRELTYEHIANEMAISKRTVDDYRNKLFEKFDIKSKVGLFYLGLRLGLVEGGDWEF